MLTVAETRADPTTSFWRSLQTLNISRVLVAFILFVYLVMRNASEAALAREACFVYLLGASGFVLLKALHRRHFLWQLSAQLLFDLLCIGVMYLAVGGIRSGLAILFLLPLAGVGILAPPLLAFFFAALASLFLLVENILRLFQDGEPGSISQAGLYGVAFFAAVFLVGRLAANLLSQEQLAQQRGSELAAQQAINRLVIEDMEIGVLMLDDAERLLEINPAAERMLGGAIDKRQSGRSLQEVEVLRPIRDALKAHRQLADQTLSAHPERISFVSLHHRDDNDRHDAVMEHDLPHAPGHVMTHLKLRFVAVRDPRSKEIGAPAAEATLIFMQDVSDIENQAQQLKLASMGRLTASIAHEVRNPLSSIAYAATLLQEDLHAPTEWSPRQAERLLDIVQVNVARLNQLIEDILKLSRKAQPAANPFSLMDACAHILEDFCVTHPEARERVLLDTRVDFAVVFDQNHLREIISNLLSNAIRYASAQPGSVRLYAHVTVHGRQELHIQDDGQGIPYEVRAHLFEPFYTTSRKGTGLGLYMARELCMNNRAMLDYEYRPGGEHGATHLSQGRFVINFSE